MIFDIKNVTEAGKKAEFGDEVVLAKQTSEVVKCQETGVLMLNIDADQLEKGDLSFIKSLGLTISNPSTDRPVALGVDYEEDSFGSKVSRWFDSDDDDDDSGFFSSPSSSGGSFGGFGGGSSFGGFGGGGFSGGGASSGF